MSVYLNRFFALFFFDKIKIRCNLEFTITTYIMTCFVCESDGAAHIYHISKAKAKDGV